MKSSDQNDENGRGQAHGDRLEQAISRSRILRTDEFPALDESLSLASDLQRTKEQ